MQMIFHLFKKDKFSMKAVNSESKIYQFITNVHVEWINYWKVFKSFLEW